MARRSRERREPTFGRSPEHLQSEELEDLEPEQSDRQNAPPRQEGPNDKASFDWFWFLFFRMPGRILTWLSFMWPTKGDVWASRRRYGNASVEVTYSIIFWIVLVLILVNAKGDR